MAFYDFPTFLGVVKERTKIVPGAGAREGPGRACPVRFHCAERRRATGETTDRPLAVRSDSNRAIRHRHSSIKRSATKCPRTTKEEKTKYMTTQSAQLITRNHIRFVRFVFFQPLWMAKEVLTVTENPHSGGWDRRIVELCVCRVRAVTLSQIV